MYIPTAVHFEPTQKCQASCPMCYRNYKGGEVNQHLEQADVSLEQFKSWFSTQFLSSLEMFYFCGNHGDPIFCPDLLEIVKYVRECNPEIKMWVTTNGGARPPEWWEELAKYVTFAIFSVDGLWDTNQIYRRGVNWARVEENMDAFISAGGVATWTFIVFEHNEHQVEEAREYSKLLGVHDFVVKKSGRYVSSSNTEKKTMKLSLNKKGDMIGVIKPPKDDKYKNKALEQDYDIIVKEYGSMDKYADVAIIDPKCKNKKEIYVSATGLVFPCCWTAGEYILPWRKKEYSSEWKLLEKVGGVDIIDLNKVKLEEVIEGGFFKEIEKSWSIEGCGNGRLKSCGMKCNTRFDPFTAQWT